MTPDLLVKVIYGTIHCKGVLASAVGTSRFGIPQGGIYGYLDADLFPPNIYTYLAQPLECSVLAYLTGWQTCCGALSLLFRMLFTFIADSAIEMFFIGLKCLKMK